MTTHTTQTIASMLSLAYSDHFGIENGKEVVQDTWIKQFDELSAGWGGVMFSYLENDLKQFIAKVEARARQEVVEERNKQFLNQLKERKYLISHDGMAEEYLQELINDYEKALSSSNKDTL